MAAISPNSKVAYMYDAATTSWYAIAGVANTNVPYTWTQSHNFSSIVTIDDVLKAKGGVNVFTNPSARDLAIPSPVDGIVCFVEQTNGGTDINQLQIRVDGAWVGLLDTVYFSSKIANYTLTIADPGKTLSIDSGSDITITVPPNSSVPFAVGQRIDFIRVGTGNVTFDQGSGVTINSKNSNKKIAARYSGATLIKYDTNTWLLIGDLMA